MRKVYFYNSKRQRLAGIIFVPKSTPAPVVIITHGFASSKRNKKEWAEFLCKRGFLVLIFDFNGHGESRGDFSDLTITQCIDDLESAVKFVNSLKHSNGRLGITGHSLGGLVSAIYASKHRPSAIAIIAAPFDLDDTSVFRNLDIMKKWKREGIRYFDVRHGRKDVRITKPLKYGFIFDRKEYNMKKLTRQITCPVLIIHGDEDEVVPFKHAELFYNSLKHHKKLVTVKGVLHSFVEKKDLKILYNETARWFEKYLD